MSLRDLKLSDLQLNACGAYSLPSGAKILVVPHTIPVFETLQANQPIVTDYEQATDPDYDFIVKAISYTGLTPGTLIQVQWPDGRYLSNAPVNLFSFCGTGKRSRGFDQPKLVPANQKIRLTLDNSAVDSVSNVEMYFEGVLRVALVNG